MPAFKLIILESEALAGELTPSETRAFIDAHAAYEESLRGAGAYVDGERFRPSAEGARVWQGEGVAHTEPGPFVDQVVSGYYVVEADTLAAALRLAEGCPLLPGGEIDVRPVMAGRFAPDKTRERGRVFAFAVLGRAANEEAWTAVMGRIDDATRHAFPEDRFMAGVRLEAPGRGRRMTNVGGRRAIFDGPFLEGKEVIGGLCFLRMTNLESAVDWARGSAFVVEGILEIRELWRS